MTTLQTFKPRELIDPTQSHAGLRKGGHHSYRVFDEKQFCTISLLIVKEILGVEIRYTEDDIFIKRQGFIHKFDKDKFKNPWDCFRELDWLDAAFHTLAKTHLKDRANNAA
jgi:hypothetical protein